MICLFRKIFAFLSAAALFAASGKAYSSSDIETCKNLLDTIVKNYDSLYEKISSSERLNPKKSVVRITKLAPEDCLTQEKAKMALSIIINALASHSGKIGVLLPLEIAATKPVVDALLSGMKAVYPSGKINFTDRVVVKNTNGSAADLEKALADLIFVDNVAMIIGGATRSEANLLSPWADKLMLPIILVSQRDTEIKESFNSFYVFPRLDVLVDSVLGYIDSKKFKRVAILQPAKFTPSKLALTLNEKLTANGVDTSLSTQYNPKDYDSMEIAAKKIFKIDNKARAAELKELYDKEKENAEKEKKEFNPQLVVLPPIIDIDAIFIPDNFRNVRHFVNIFKYLGVEKIPIIGNQEWRAQGLVDPYEPFLDGAVFVDYIRSYQELPQRIRPEAGDSPYFVKPEETAKIDYQIIGYHAINLAEQTLKGVPEKRRKLTAKLARIEIRDSVYFTNGPAFDKDRNANWPSFLFKVVNKGIEPLSGSYIDLLKSSIPKKEVPSRGNTKSH
ncbi:MAG: hypothetical protein HQK54_17010 [Oligoflexales bacterium]|nr:hypothetical protein [Oligoflexales bacterium]